MWRLPCRAVSQRMQWLERGHVPVVCCGYVQDVDDGGSMHSVRGMWAGSVPQRMWGCERGHVSVLCGGHVQDVDDDGSMHSVCCMCCGVVLEFCVRRLERWHVSVLC